MCHMGMQSTTIARGVRGMPPEKRFQMDSLRHILAHSQPNIMMEGLFTRTPQSAAIKYEKHFPKM